MISQIVILCGGRGTRLGEITEQIPKPMLKFAGEPFLKFLIKKYSKYPIDEILLLAGYLGEQIKDEYDNTVFNGVKIRVIIEKKPLGTLGAVLGSYKELATQFLLTNGDSYVEFDFWKLRNWWNSVKKKCNSAIVVGSVNDTSRYGQIKVSENHITEFVEKDDFNTKGLINLGIYLIKKESLLSHFPTENSNLSLEKVFLPNLISNRSLFYFKINNHSLIDFGVPKDLDKLKYLIKSKQNNKAVFFDRDNTINVDKGYTYKTNELKLCKGISRVIRQFNENNFKVFIVSNQSGVARGFYTKDHVIKFHKELKKELSNKRAFIDDFRFCPHHPTEGFGNLKSICSCRKPETGMIDDLVNSWNLNLSKCVFIGDSLADKLCAERAGVDFIETKCQQHNKKINEYIANRIG